MPLSSALRTWLVAGSACAVAAAAGLWLWPAEAPAPVPPVAPSAKVEAAGFRDAFVEIAVATALGEEELAAYENRQTLLQLLESFAPDGPGEAGAIHARAVAMLRDDQASTFETMSAERFILPPVADADLIAPALDTSERERFFASKSVLVLRFRGPGGPPHHTARIAFGMAVAVAERVGGILDDEVRRRVEMPAAVKARSVLPAERSAFRDGAISVELDPDEDSSTRGRLLSLGMKRYGAPDLELQAVSVEDAPAASRLLTALCRLGASRALPDSFSTSLAELFPDQPERAGGAPFRVQLASAPMATGNPDNELLTVTFEPTVRERLIRELGLVGGADAGLHAESDSEFEQRLARVQRELPALVTRWRETRGSLFLLVDFQEGKGAEAQIESMWVETLVLDARGTLQGTLANEPAHVLGLHHGDRVTVERPVVSGYRLELPSGERVAFP